MKGRTQSAIAARALALWLALCGCSASRPPQTVVYSAPAPTSVRLYVMDCGVIRVADPARFRMTRAEVSNLDLSVPCFLVVHPKGNLLWDTGAVPDDVWSPNGRPFTYTVTLPERLERPVTVVRSLRSQLAESGYTPRDIRYLALSHYHYDHTANANDFANATWLVRKVERDTMFAANPPGVTQPSTYAALRNSRTVIIDSPTYDVFGDGTVVIRWAPGHTPGHQLLQVKLAQTGDVMLSGDLYHYPEARELQRLPTFDFDQVQSAASRAAIETFLKQTGAQLWIQHDLAGNARLKKAPAYYQ